MGELRDQRSRRSQGRRERRRLTRRQVAAPAQLFRCGRSSTRRVVRELEMPSGRKLRAAVLCLATAQRRIQNTSVSADPKDIDYTSQTLHTGLHILEISPVIQEYYPILTKEHPFNFFPTCIYHRPSSHSHMKFRLSDTCDEPAQTEITPDLSSLNSSPKSQQFTRHKIWKSLKQRTTLRR